MVLVKARGGVIYDRFHYPIGLRIGGNLPQEIALSILAEVILVMRGGKPGHMRRDWS